MKIIDLLNKISNGEEVRFKIDENQYHCYRYSNLYDEVEKEEVKWYISEDWLNEEVEVIEDKKIEKFNDYIPIGLTGMGADFRKQDVFESLLKIGDKINEIIDVINKGDK